MQRITQTILTSIMTVLVSTTLLYIFEMRAEMTLIKNRLDKIEETIRLHPIALNLPNLK